MVVATLTKLVPAIREEIFSAPNHVTENLIGHRSCCRSSPATVDEPHIRLAHVQSVRSGRFWWVAIAQLRDRRLPQT
jgi:hypothetical protein